MDWRDGSFMHRCWAVVDLDAFEENYHALRSRLREDTKLLAVVKADAYGHGDQQVARLMEEVGADWLGVACYDEALSLRAAGIRLPILILGHTPVELCGGLAEQEITQAIFSPQYARDLRREAARPLVPRPVQIHNLSVFHPPRLLSFYWIRRKPGAAGHRFPPKKSPPWQKAPGELPPGKAVPPFRTVPPSAFPWGCIVEASTARRQAGPYRPLAFFHRRTACSTVSARLRAAVAGSMASSRVTIPRRMGKKASIPSWLQAVAWGVTLPATASTVGQPWALARRATPTGALPMAVCPSRRPSPVITRSAPARSSARRVSSRTIRMPDSSSPPRKV